MILIADSGSTKTEWRTVVDGQAGFSYISSGISPYFVTVKEIITVLEKEMSDLKGKSVSRVYFYGTGVSSIEKAEIVRKALATFFRTEELFIGSDLLGAARSLCMNEPGIACIIGTGSNSCYYDGKKIVSNVAPLGYILGDEGGGAVLGRKLLAGILKKHLPDSIIEKFFATYSYTPSEILDNVYNMPFPNRFLGQFTRFIGDNIHEPELQSMLVTSLDDFLISNVMQYPESRELPVHFTGGIAFHFRSFIEDLLEGHHLQPGKFTLSPIENLLKFHIHNLHL